MSNVNKIFFGISIDYFLEKIFGKFSKTFFKNTVGKFFENFFKTFFQNNFLKYYPLLCIIYTKFIFRFFKLFNNSNNAHRMCKCSEYLACAKVNH